METTDEYPYDDYEGFDDNGLFKYHDDPGDNYKDSKDDTDEDTDEDNGDQEYLFRCAARFKGGTICGAIFQTQEDVYAHLNQKHHTSKWLVDEFVKIQN